MKNECYCNSEKDFSNCCEQFISNEKVRETPESCMRSRYSAYCLKKIDYIIESTYPTERKFYPKAKLLDWADSVQWIKLEIVAARREYVEFKAYFTEGNPEIRVHHEKSLFKQENGSWYFYSGEVY